MLLAQLFPGRQDFRQAAKLDCHVALIPPAVQLVERFDDTLALVILDIAVDDLL